MSFHPIVLGLNTYNQSGVPGRYVLSTLAFGDPDNSFRISGGTYNKKTGFTNASILRRVEIDVTEGGVISRRPMSITLGFQMPKGATVALADAATGQLSDLVTEAFLNRLLNGEQ